MKTLYAFISLLFLLVPGVAHAYIDPGSGGAIITAVLGAVGAVGYTVRKYYYRIKRLFSRGETVAASGEEAGAGDSSEHSAYLSGKTDKNA